MNVKDLLTIGEFSNLSGLSRRALRLYDERGIFEPAQTDSRTGYRMYTREQLSRAELIRAARRAGMPLRQIVLLLDESSAKAHERIARFAADTTRSARLRWDAAGVLHRLVDTGAVPDDAPKTAFGRGNHSYFKRRDPQEALELYSAVTPDDPRYATAQRYIGYNIYGREWGRWEDGLPYLEEARRAAPDDRKVLEDIGRTYAHLGRMDEARACLLEAATPVAYKALARLAETGAEGA